MSGGDLEISDTTDLQFRGTNGVKAGGSFKAIDVRETRLMAVESKRGGLVVLEIPQLTSVQARKFSVGKTVGLSVGLTIGIPSVLAAITIGALASSGGFGGGRPLRVAGAAAPTRALLVRHRRAARRPVRGVDEATRERLFTHWAQEASTEGASIPAFLALARDLRLAGAPSGLVEQALRAAREEAGHTAFCTKMANSYAGEEGDIGVVIPAVPENRDRSWGEMMERLAVEAWEDGCLAEGTSAAVARRTAEGMKAGDGKVRSGLRRIAVEEQGHADLAGGILEFCLSSGGRGVLGSLRDAEQLGEEEEQDARSEDCCGIDEDLARIGGKPAPAVIRAAKAEVRENRAGGYSRTPGW
ncbi:MAG: hypothetical protein ABJE95_19900 [Byssovorax sp.]